MKRPHLLLMGIGIVFVVAVGLRVRSQFARKEVSLEESGSARTKPAFIPVPRDYVVDPVVAAGEVGKGPGRIISLAPSITEVVCALGMGGRLVGRSTYSTYPPGIERVVSVGSLVDANLAKIKGLNPDLILVTSNSGSLIDKLTKLELRYETVPHGSLADVYESIEKVAAVCDRGETARLLVRVRRPADTTGRHARRGARRSEALD